MNQYLVISKGTYHTKVFDKDFDLYNFIFRYKKFTFFIYIWFTDKKITLV